MKHFNYDELGLENALDVLGIKKGDLILCHNNIGTFGRWPNHLTSKQWLGKIFEIITNAIGVDGTLIVPAFTYSAPQNQIFDPSEISHNVGVLANYIFSNTDAIRTLDPNVSFLVYGYLKNEVINIKNFSPYSSDGIFNWLLKKNVKILNLNFDAGTTLLHYLEKEKNVSYRYMKSFTSLIKHKDKIESVKSDLYVNDLSKKWSTADFSKFGVYAKKNGFFHELKVGRGHIGLITAVNLADCFEEFYKIYPLGLTQWDEKNV